MHSTLIIATDAEKRETEARELCLKEGIDQFDIAYVERTPVESKSDETKKKASLGINEVKQMQKKIFLKPFRGDKKAIIVKDAHTLTIEAQNALLKVLEEPPLTTLIILTAEDDRSLLPTILSRCKVVVITSESPEIAETDKQALLLMIQKPVDTGTALKTAETLAKSKADALIWLENYILVARDELLKASNANEKQKVKLLVEKIKSAQHLRVQAKTTNGNLRLLLESFLL